MTENKNNLLGNNYYIPKSNLLLFLIYSVNIYIIRFKRELNNLNRKIEIIYINGLNIEITYIFL